MHLTGLVLIGLWVVSCGKTGLGCWVPSSPHGSSGRGISVGNPIASVVASFVSLRVCFFCEFVHVLHILECGRGLLGERLEFTVRSCERRGEGGPWVAPVHGVLPMWWGQQLSGRIGSWMIFFVARVSSSPLGRLGSCGTKMGGLSCHS